MTDKNIFIVAAKRVSCGLSDYSCLAVTAAETLAGTYNEVLREWYSNAFSPSTSRKLLAVDIGESVPQRKFRVLLLLMAAACVEDMRQVGGEWGEW